VEEGFGRSLTFSDVFTSASNVVGAKPIYEMADWMDEENRYPFQRAEPLCFDLALERKRDNKPLIFGGGEPSEEMMNPERLRHDQRRVLSIIETDLWDAARWRGIGIAVYQNYPPFLGLMFENENPARKIFDNWKKRFGDRDVDNAIRFCIITGIDKKHPSSYTAMVSANFENALSNRTPHDQVLISSRRQKMDSPNPANLRAFLSAYREYGCYFLAPTVPEKNSADPNVITDSAILKRELIIRPEWEIAEHDFDCMALSSDDDPIIPEGILDAPIIKTMQRRQRMEREKVVSSPRSI
jgi:hypothetical protein